MNVSFDLLLGKEGCLLRMPSLAGQSLGTKETILV